MTINWNGNNWMSNIDDNKRLSEISIPGTHDSATSYAQTGSLKTFIPFVSCQNTSILDQLNSGIRVFDLRCQYKDNQLKIVHDTIEFNFPLDSILTDIQTFLTNNDEEIVIIFIKKEGDDPNPPPPPDTFANAVKSYTVTYPIFYQGTTSYDQVPTIANLRGKVLLIKRFSDPNNVLDFAVDLSNGWQDDAIFSITVGNAFVCQIEDKYKLDLLYDADAKFDDIKNQIYTLNSGTTSSDNWFITFSSAYGVFSTRSVLLTPVDAALQVIPLKAINNYLYNFLNENQFSNLGTIMMDFPEKRTMLDGDVNQLINQIIATNF